MTLTNSSTDALQTLRAQLGEALTSSQTHAVSIGQAYVDCLEAWRQALPHDPLDSQDAWILLGRERCSWALVAAARAFDRHDPAVAQAHVNEALKALDGLTVADEVGLLSWVGRYGEHLETAHVMTLLRAVRLKRAAQRVVEAALAGLARDLQALGERQPERLLEWLTQLATDEGFAEGRVWQSRFAWIAELLRALMASLEAGGRLGALADAIKAVLECLPAPWGSVACLPVVPAQANVGLMPRLEDLKDAPDEVLEAPGAGAWLTSLGEEGLEALAQVCRQEAFLRDGRRSWRFRYQYVSRLIRAYQALKEAEPALAAGYLSRALWGGVVAGRRARRYTRMTRMAGRVFEKEVFHSVLGDPRNGLLNSSDSLRLRVADALVPERMAEAASLIEQVLSKHETVLSDQVMAIGPRRLLFNPLIDKLRLLAQALRVIQRLPEGLAAPLAATVSQRFEDEVAWLLDSDSRGIDDLGKAGVIFAAMPALASRLLAERASQDEDLAELIGTVRKTVGSSLRVEAALFEVSSMLWDPHRRYWSRERMLAEVACHLLQDAPDLALKLAGRVRHADVRSALASELFLCAQPMSGLGQPLLDSLAGLPLATPQGLVLSAIARGEASAIEAIASMPDPFNQALAYALASRLPGDAGRQAADTLELMLGEIQDDGALATLLCRIGLHAGPDFGPNTRRSYRALFRAADQVMSYEEDVTTPFLFQQIHRLPPAEAEAVLGDYLTDPLIEGSYFEVVRVLLSRPTTLSPEAWERIVRLAANRVLTHAEDRMMTPFEPFVAELARLDIALARQVCEACTESDVQELAYEALAPYDLDAAQAYLDAQGGETEWLSAEALDWAARLHACAHAPEAYQEALATCPESALLLTMARQHFSEWPQWLIEAHAAAGAWHPLLVARASLPGETIAALEAALERQLLLPPGKERFLPVQTEGILLLSAYLAAWPSAAAIFIERLAPQTDPELRWIMVRKLARSPLPAPTVQSHLARLLATALPTASIETWDQLWSCYTECSLRE